MNIAIDQTKRDAGLKMIDAGEWAEYHQNQISKHLNDYGWSLTHSRMATFWNNQYHKLKVAYDAKYR